MRTGAATPTGGRGSRTTGVVAGFVLKPSRQGAGLTPERLAELLGVDPTTVQGRESGRRPLAAVSAGELLKLSARLSRAGAPASTGRHLNEAIEADLVLATGITAGDSWVDPDHHPLAAAVHRKTITNLITWPFTGNTPPQLGEFISKVPRRGPVTPHPLLHADERCASSTT
jgi:transcriptional regulator with XRE-family HTH domain